MDILKRYTDENHRLSQKQIADILKKEYNVKVERKTIKRNIMNLIDFGYEIEYTETVRFIKNKSGILSGKFCICLTRDLKNSFESPSILVIISLH